MPPASPQIVLSLGAIAGCLSVLWLTLQIIAWFRPRDSYATKSELAELREEMERRLGGLDTSLKVLTSTIQVGFNDLNRSIGKLEGKAGVA